MIRRRHVSALALALATLAAAACSNPTAPSTQAPRTSNDQVIDPTKTVQGITNGSSI